MVDRPLAEEVARREAGMAGTDDNRRDAFDGVLIGAGNYTVEKAERLLATDLIDAAAFGRAFIANPDLPAAIARSGVDMSTLKVEYLDEVARRPYVA